jgi:hypothetical protein
MVAVGGGDLPLTFHPVAIAVSDQKVRSTLVSGRYLMQPVIMRATTGVVVNVKQAQLASFIGTHLQELTSLAQRAGLDTLCFLLEMATLEAETVAGDGHAADVEPDSD